MGLNLAPQQWAVLIEIDHGEFMYATAFSPFDYHTPILIFDTKEAAEQCASQWNTGIVVDAPSIPPEEIPHG
jgi:hypothetical protein